ncbi:uncharacterized protein ACBT44_011269 isoform 2-T2 [Syngnathus typhle]
MATVDYDLGVTSRGLPKTHFKQQNMQQWHCICAKVLKSFLHHQHWQDLITRRFIRPTVPRGCSIDTLKLRKENMHSEKVIVIICTFAILAISAYPHRGTRDVTWTDSKANQAQPKSEITKEADKIYKSQIDDSSLYHNEDEYNKNPFTDEMQRKIIGESDRLRARLHQELAQLRERLAPSPAHLASMLASVRERLAPLAQQLDNNTHGLCNQLKMYVSPEVNPYPEVHGWMTQELEQSASKMADILAEFMSQTREVTERLREMSEVEVTHEDFWRGFSSRLESEVKSLKAEVQNSLETLKAELADQSESVRPLKAAVECFCQLQTSQARIERLLTSMEEELEVQLSSSHPVYSGGLLQEDFSVKLSALIQDILHSVQ